MLGIPTRHERTCLSSRVYASKKGLSHLDPNRHLILQGSTCDSFPSLMKEPESKWSAHSVDRMPSGWQSVDVVQIDDEQYILQQREDAPIRDKHEEVKKKITDWLFLRV